MTAANAENYRILASEAREKASAAAHPTEAAAHIKMAELYDQLADDPEDDEVS